MKAEVDGSDCLFSTFSALSAQSLNFFPALPSALLQELFEEKVDNSNRPFRPRLEHLLAAGLLDEGEAADITAAADGEDGSRYGRGMGGRFVERSGPTCEGRGSSHHGRSRWRRCCWVSRTVRQLGIGQSDVKWLSLGLLDGTEAAAIIAAGDAQDGACRLPWRICVWGMGV